ncbi:methylated-DNA--[protein]-cysteine S-methyltransferase [Arsukibacterium sp.]|uniref:methylated-DNA--[protein]-cysteine S-methyltransferase n=1 Tax=Arsukibacterium sp. TaxID=1977258 RepID=UPI002FDA6497
MLSYDYLSSPLGLIEIAATEQGVAAVSFCAQPRFAVQPQQALAQQHWAQQAKNQLAAYFAKELTQFELPLCASGTLFQQQVWQALTTVPYGKTASYGDIAKAINNPKGVRAVGLANGKNPLGIIVPCHRIIGANGTLTGYAGGLDKKAWLLAHEGITGVK